MTAIFTRQVLERGGKQEGIARVKDECNDMVQTAQGKKQHRNELNWLCETAFSTWGTERGGEEMEEVPEGR